VIALVGSTFLVIFFCFAGGNELSLVSSLFFFDLKLQVREWPFFIDAADIIYFISVGSGVAVVVRRSKDVAKDGSSTAIKKKPARATFRCFSRRHVRRRGGQDREKKEGIHKGLLLAIE
jgi:hypothetical protein